MVKRLLSILGRYNVKHLLVLMILFVSSQQALKADHVMGADMSYVCLGSGKYKLIIKFYRDCRVRRLHRVGVCCIGMLVIIRVCRQVDMLLE